MTAVAGPITDFRGTEQWRNYVSSALPRGDWGGGGWIAKWVASSVRVPKGPGSIPGVAKVLGTDGICKYLPLSVSSYVEVSLWFIVLGL